MAEHEPQSKSLRDYAEFELERRGYDRAQVDAFLAELDQAFLELEKSLHERGTELAEIQREVERLKRESPAGKSEEILRRAEENAEQMLTSTIAESQQIIGNAETMAMRIIANARAQSQEIAHQPAGFGMLARVRTIAADIDRIKAEHTALMEDEPALLGPELGDLDELSDAAEAATDDKAEATAKQPATKPAAKRPAAKRPAAQKSAPKKPAAADKPTAGKKPAAAKKESAKTDADKEPAKKGPASKPAKKKEAPAAKTASEPVVSDDEDASGEPGTPRIKLVEPPPPEPEPVANDADDEYVVADTKNFDWGAARQEALHALDDEGLPLVEELTGLEETTQEGDADDEPDDADLPTIMRRQGSRYERHSASLPKKQDDGGESTLANVSKVSRRRARRASMRDDEA